MCVKVRYITLDGNNLCSHWCLVDNALTTIVGFATLKSACRPESVHNHVGGDLLFFFNWLTLTEYFHRKVYIALSVG